MICSICANIHFKLLSQWGRPAEETSDKSNTAFSLYYTSDHAVHEWQAGDGMLHVYYFHHSSAIQLRVSATEGCYLCAMILFALFSSDNQLEDSRIVIPSVPPSFEKPIVMALFLSQSCKSWQTVEDNEHISLFCGSKHARLDSLCAYTKTPLREEQYHDWCAGLELAWSTDKMEPYASTWSALNQNIAKSWYRSCLREHEGCNVSTSVLPKRVIDVGDFGSSRAPVLIEPKEGTSAKYITLSHFWGHKLPLSVSPSDTEGRWILPPLCEWPQAFQDAVLVAQTFLIRYLWIDAPCILQNSKSDWEIESGKMAQYFANSAFTIAAACAVSGSDGLFSYRNPLMTYPYCLKLHSNTTGGVMFERYLCVGTEDSFPGVDETSSSDSVLYSRGWVLQEELLAPRVLRFGRKGLYWRCRSQVQSEAILQNDCSRPQRAETLPLQLAFPEPSKGWTHGRNPHHDIWYKILRKLNRRNITYKNDILPALSGISAVISDYLPRDDRFLAGIWQSDITVGLLWCKAGTSSFRPDVLTGLKNFDENSFYAPTWSWVSSASKELNFELHPKILPPGGVLLRTPPDTELVQAIIDVQNPLSPFGRITSGLLVFLARCPTVTIFLSKRPVTEVSYEARVLELRGTSAGGENLYCHMEVEGSEFPTLASIPGLTGDITGDCIIDMDEPTMLRRYNPLDYLSILLGGRSSLKISGIFLPLINYDTEDTQPSGFRDRALGLALVPVSGEGQSAGAASIATDVQLELYTRIGRAALNISPSRLRASKIPSRLIGLV